MTTKIVVPPSCCGVPSLINVEEGGWCRGCEVRERCVRLAYPKLKRIANSAGMHEELVRFEAVHAETLTRSTVAKLPTPAGQGETLTPNDSDRLRESDMTLTDRQREILASLPVKIAPKVRVLMQKRVDQAAPVRLAQGLNPFTEADPRYLQIAGELLLERRSISRSELRKRLIDQLGWTEGTAASHVSAVVAILPALGIATADHLCLALVQNTREILAA